MREWVGVLCGFLWSAAAVAAVTAPPSVPAPTTTPAVVAPALTRAVAVDAFTFSVQPDRIVVGETETATIRLQAKDPYGAPLDVAPPSLLASTGTLTPPVRVGAGIWTTTYGLPKERFPHVALISATIDHGEATSLGFATIPLWGRGQTTVKTKADSQVTVFVGADAFGPIAAGADGDAVVPILVPPGPEHAVAKSVDAVGNTSQKSIDLRVPPFNRLGLIPLDDIVSGDGDGVARLVAFAVDKKGTPLIDATLIATVPVGTLSPPRAVAPGIFELVWRPGAVKAQTVPISLALEGAKLSTATTTVRVIAGAPATAKIVVAQQAVSADESPELSVRLTVFDHVGNPVPFGAARVDVDVGRIDTASGEVSRALSWVLPRERDQSEANLVVKTVDGRVLGRQQVKLLPGKPASLRIDPMEDIVADGSAGATLIVAAFDQWGNEVSPGAVELAADGGRIVAANLDATARRFRALYVPTPRDEDDVVEIEASLGKVKTRRALRLRARPRPLLLVGPSVGSAWSYGDVLAVGPELSLLLRLPVLDGAVHAGVTLGLHEGIASASTVTFAQYRTFPVLLEAGWRPLITPELGIHLGGAGGLVVVDSAILIIDGEVRAIEPGLAGAAVVGVFYRLGPGVIEVDARLGYGAVLGTPFIDAHPFGAGVVVGYRFGI